MKKIVLIEAKSSHLHLYSNVHIPREGSVLLGTLLQDKGYDVSVYVEDFGPIDYQDMLSADLVGFSTLTSTAPRSYELAAMVRKAGIPVIFGGTHVSFLPEEGLQHGDYVLRVEADETFPDFVQRMDNGESLEDIPGLSYIKNGELVNNPSAVLPTELDSLPIPDYSLIRNGYPGEVISISTARGCPFDCSFCSVTAYNGKAFRAKSVERVLEELEYQLSRYKVHYLFWADDIFNYNKKRAKDIFKGMIERGLTPRWGAQMRHEASLDPELMDLMREANCERVMVGFESINQATLDLFGKRESVEQVVKSLDTFHAHKVKVHGMFVVGSDEDTVETIRETAAFAKKHNLDSLQMMMLIPLPGAKDYIPYGNNERKTVTDNWEIFDGHHAVIFPKKMSAYDLQHETMKQMRKFYSFGRVIKRLLRGDIEEFFLRLGAWSLVKRWFKNPYNTFYENQLKEFGKVDVEADKKMRARIRNNAIILPDLFANASTIKAIKVFLNKLGVEVLKSEEDVSEKSVWSKKIASLKAKELVNWLYSYLEKMKVSADFVLIPRLKDVGAAYSEKFWGDVEVISQTIKKAVHKLPEIVTYSIDDTSQSLSEMLDKIGRLFTDDVKQLELAHAESAKYYSAN